jgi:SAM-dependent methyltransferase
MNQRLQRILRRVRGGGVRWLMSAMADRIAPAHPAMRPTVRAVVSKRIGLEIGGPSRVFSARGMLPVYPHAMQIDNVNFATETAWEQGLRDGGDFPFDRHRAPGKQWLREAVALTGIVDETYDFVVSSHCLEHVANPLRALREWYRVVRRDGHMLVVLPDPKRSFDHRRPVTTFAHLQDDFQRNVDEDDTTHVAEALALHDVARDPGVASPAEFAERVRANRLNRCLHHHVFDLLLLTSALHETGWRVLTAETARPLHLIAFAQKETT